MLFRKRRRVEIDIERRDLIVANGEHFGHVAGERRGVLGRAEAVASQCTRFFTLYNERAQLYAGDHRVEPLGAVQIRRLAAKLPGRAREAGECHVVGERRLPSVLARESFEIRLNRLSGLSLIHISEPTRQAEISYA